MTAITNRIKKGGAAAAAPGKMPAQSFLTKEGISGLSDLCGDTGAAELLNQMYDDAFRFGYRATITDGAYDYYSYDAQERDIILHLRGGITKIAQILNSSGYSNIESETGISLPLRDAIEDLVERRYNSADLLKVLYEMMITSVLYRWQDGAVVPDYDRLARIHYLHEMISKLIKGYLPTAEQRSQ